MIRARFKCNQDDYRPVTWPPPGPYWCTGYMGDSSAAFVVAYAESADQLYAAWPDAFDMDIMDEDTEIIYTDRFPQPEWWPPAQEES